MMLVFDFLISDFIWDLHLMSRTAQKISDVLLIIGFIVLFIFPDVVMSVFMELFHFLLEFAHISFEALESTLDFVIENLFNTGVYKTQLIVFYLMMAGVAYGAYQFWLRLPTICTLCHKNTMIFWITYKMRFLLYWQYASLLSKIRLIAVALGVGYLVFLLSF